MSQISTRSRGQVRKASTQTSSALRLRKKVAPKLVSTRPKRTPSAPKNKGDDTANHSIAPQQDEGIVPDTETADITDTSHEGSNSNVPQTGACINNFENVTSQSMDLAEHTQSIFGLDVDLHSRAINVDDFFANQQTCSSVTMNNTIDVLTSEDSELLELTGGTSNVHLELTQVEQQEQPPLPVSHRPDLNRTEGTVSEGVDSLRTNGGANDATTACNDDVTVVGTQEQSSSKQKNETKTAKKRTRRDSTSASPDQPSQTRSGDSVSPPRPKKKKNAVGKERKAPDRTTMTMQELIYYNPTSNPMLSSTEEKEKRKQQSLPSSPEKDTPQNNKDESQPETTTSQTGQTGNPVDVGERQSDDVAEGNGGVKENDRIVPQLQIGADGNIIINEESMLMKTTLTNDAFNDSETVIETGGQTTSDSFRKTYKITRWSKEENSKFFKALSHVGTDFTMMTLLVPKRSRKELKNKFKREEKKNPHLIAQALRNQIKIPSKSRVLE